MVLPDTLCLHSSPGKILLPFVGQFFLKSIMLVSYGDTDRFELGCIQRP